MGTSYWRKPVSPSKCALIKILLSKSNATLKRGRQNETEPSAKYPIAICNPTHYTKQVIKSFAHKGLQRFFLTGNTRGLPGQYADRILRILDRLDAITTPHDMNLPGYGFHRLKGQRQDTYSVRVSANWRITFTFKAGNAFNVNLEDYH